MDTDNKIFPMLAKTFAGLEDVLRDELISMGAQQVETANRAVSFEGDKEMLYRANLCCRTALSILLPIEMFTASDPDDLYDKVRDIDWGRYMSPDDTFSIAATVNSADFPHSRFAVYRVKDGIADHFNDTVGRRPSIRLQGADRQFDLHISENRVTISLNSSGEPLSKRGYRVEATEAPLNEVLAAGIILKTGWRGDSPFFDPMCGSGTFLIEAALIAANINPGVFRSGYAFERWPDFDSELFEQLYNDDSEERDPAYPIIGADIDPEAVQIARKNIRSARLENMIRVECRDFAVWQEPPVSDPGIIITNPPYSERLKVEDPQMLFHTVGSQLKRLFGGWHAWILGYRDEDFASIGLKPSVKFPINNGGLECTLREYVLFDGNYADFKSEGGTVHNDSFVRRTKPQRRASDSEWERSACRVSGDRPERKGGRNERRARAPRRFKEEYSDDRKQRRFDRNDAKSEGRKQRRLERDDHKRADRKPFKQYQGSRSAYTPTDRAPRIDASHTAFSSPGSMRSRKVWKKRNEDENEDD